MDIRDRDVWVVDLGHDALGEGEPDLAFEGGGGADGLFGGSGPLRVCAGSPGGGSLGTGDVEQQNRGDAESQGGVEDFHISNKVYRVAGVPEIKKRHGDSVSVLSHVPVSQEKLRAEIGAVRERASTTSVSHERPVRRRDTLPTGLGFRLFCPKSVPFVPKVGQFGGTL